MSTAVDQRLPFAALWYTARFAIIRRIDVSKIAGQQLAVVEHSEDFNAFGGYAINHAKRTFQQLAHVGMGMLGETRPKQGWLFEHQRFANQANGDIARDFR